MMIARDAARNCRLVRSANEKHRNAMQRGLRAALMATRIVAYYDPVVALECSQIVRFEARPRWESNDFGQVEGGQLIALAEEAGLITELNDQLLNQACLDARNWPSQLMLAVYISPMQLNDRMLASRVVNILTSTGFNPRRLQLEVTEAVFGETNEPAQEFIKQLRQMGVKIALDDVGTGCAPLVQLLDFQFDRIKIDRRFVEHLGKDNDSAIIMRAMISLAYDFGIVVTAKGIPSTEHLAILIASGCQEGQGACFGGPVPASEIPVVLDRMQSGSVRQFLKPI
jgi:EAL domain-containing protein (putative c-di-GMP-specific phosphodiesterase class I)